MKLWPWSLRTPSRRQIDPIECGAVCLGIILQHYGRYVDTATLRDSARVSRSGSDAHSLIEAAKKYFLLGKAKKILVSDLKHITAPAILFFDQCHFVVFEGVRFARYHINDPARGRYSLDVNAFRRRFSNIVIEFIKGPGFVKGELSTSLQRTTLMLLAPTKFLVGILGLVAGITFVMMAALASLNVSLDQELPNEYSWFAGFSLLTLLLALAFNGFSLCRAIMLSAHSVCQHEIFALQHCLLKTPASFFDDRPFLTFARVFASSAERSYLMAEARVVKCFWWAFFLIIVVEVALLSLPIAIALISALGIFLCQKSYRAWRSNTAIRTMGDFHMDVAINHAISQSEAMRAMGQDELLIDGLIKKELDSWPREHSGFLFNIMTSAILLAAILFAIMSLIATQSWRHGELPLVKIFELTMLSFGLLFAGLKISRQRPCNTDDVTSLLVDMTMAKKPVIEARLEDQSHKLVKLSGSFSYPGADKAIWHNVEVEFKRHELVGMVGNSQSGISTLFRLLAGSLALSSGEIMHFLLHDTPLKVVLINEDSDLFLGSLKDNITLFDRGISEHDVVWALEQAEAVDLFYDRPMGLIAPILSQGKNLSMGEKKRLLLAQALAHKPDLILLDDFFLSLDEKTSLKILENIKAIGVAVLFNSHAGRELLKSDRVIFVDSEAALMSASHEHFYSTNESYRRLLRVENLGDPSI